MFVLKILICRFSLLRMLPRWLWLWHLESKWWRMSRWILTMSRSITFSPPRRESAFENRANVPYWSVCSCAKLWNDRDIEKLMHLSIFISHSAVFWQKNFFIFYIQLTLWSLLIAFDYMYGTVLVPYSVIYVMYNTKLSVNLSDYVNLNEACLLNAIISLIIVNFLPFFQMFA